MMSGVDLPAAHIRNQVASAIDVVVHLARLRDGRRVIWEIAAVEGTHRGGADRLVAVPTSLAGGRCRRVRGDGLGAASPTSSPSVERTSATGCSNGSGPVIGLVSGLLALAGLLAERAIARARGGQARSPDRGVCPMNGSSRDPLDRGVDRRRSRVRSRGRSPARRGRDRRRPRRSSRHPSATSRARRGLVADQLADAVSATAAGLRSGTFLPQSLAYARDEVDEPLRSDLDRLVGAIDVGVPIAEALDAWAEMHGTEDARLLAGVLDLHRRSGGDLPSVLDGLAVTLRERRNAQREVRALTAQARLSGVILGLLPIGFFAFLMLTSRHEMLEAIATPLGGSALGIGLGSKCSRSCGSAISWRCGDRGDRRGGVRGDVRRLSRRGDRARRPAGSIASADRGWLLTCPSSSSPPGWGWCSLLPRCSPFRSRSSSRPSSVVSPGAVRPRGGGARWTSRSPAARSPGRRIGRWAVGRDRARTSRARAARSPWRRAPERDRRGGDWSPLARGAVLGR